jgi:hypothetical protein
MQDVPFDPEEYCCCYQRGVDEFGEPYGEYCIEDNPGYEAKWSHEYCCGVAAWSTNDGIWRVYDKLEEGNLRKVVLTFYDCSWKNEIYNNDGTKLIEGYLQDAPIPMTFYFKEVYTSYGYNVTLEDEYTVAGDTVVLVDFKDYLIDPADPLLPEDLNDPDSARHLGKHNVLYADESVRVVGTASLYPSINPDQWTPEFDE